MQIPDDCQEDERNRILALTAKNVTSAQFTNPTKTSILYLDNCEADQVARIARLAYPKEGQTKDRERIRKVKDHKGQYSWEDLK